MDILDTLPSVFELVHECEDEVAALSTTCRWLRHACGADAAAFLSVPEHAIVAAAGWTIGDTRQSLEPGATSVRASTPTAVPGPVVSVSARVRYAGVTIGLVVARVGSERQATMARAVETVAAVCAPALRTRLDALAAARVSQASMPEILGRSPSIVAFRESIARAAATPFGILLEGESGTGKELAARALHRLSPRRDRRFCAVNCAALTDELVEAELFGHARGAFTGAVGPRVGLFEEAHTGSLFLDEVGELSPRAQAKLLRVLQEGEVRRVGENAARIVNVRVIAATNRSLADMTTAGSFRADLFFRLAVVRIRLPALRARIEDIPVLALACWKALMRDTGKRAVLGPDTIASLCRHPWPGNVRELQNVMAAVAVLAPARGRVGARLVRQVLASTPHQPDVALPLDAARVQCEQQTVAGALARHGGRRAAAARELGLTRQGLTKAMKRLGLEHRRDEAGVA